MLWKKDRFTRVKEEAAFLVAKKQEDCFESISEAELEEIAELNMAVDSIQASKWVMKNLGDWVGDHNRGNPSNFC